jgi:hypothetical protein
MNCGRIDERLLGVTAAEPEPAFDAAELEHLRECPRCRERAAEASAAFARLTRAASSEAPPGPAYWASIVPRLRRRIGVEPRDISQRLGNPVIVKWMVPAAAAVVIAIVAVVSLVRMPERAGADSAGPGTPDKATTLASLSDAELHELRLSGATSGILETAETIGAADWTIADFLSDLVSEEGDSVLYAVAEPEDLLTRVDDAEFAEIVSILERK